MLGKLRSYSSSLIVRIQQCGKRPITSRTAGSRTPTASCQATTPTYGVSYTYDADADELTETHHYSQTPTNGRPNGVTTKFYDGLDRLVEVELPHDPQWDVYAFPWLTRYIYDLTNGQTVSLSNGVTFNAYGNLYKTQECLQATNAQITAQTTVLGPSITGTCTFQDVRGASFDALDRGISKYELSTGNAPQSTNTYDGNGNYGLLSQTSNGAGQSKSISYDAAGHVTDDTFTDNVTANRHYQYDPDGRIASDSNNLGTVATTYDADGSVTRKTTASSLPYSGTILYSYYPDGTRQSLGLSIPGASFNAPNLFAYSYRPDGLRTTLAVTTASTSGNFAWTYTAAGRELTESDPFTGQAFPVQ